MNNAAALPATISGNADALLPQKYEAARSAIAECERIDECKTWSDKAAALASYARQAKDDSLAVMARRIQARAERRMGELLKQFPDGRTAALAQHREVGARLTVTRVQAATSAGISDHQRKQALRVANVPAAAFDSQVDSPTPPTVTRLAEQGKTTRDVSLECSPWNAIACPETREGCETLERFARFCERLEPTAISRTVNAAEAEEVRQLIEIADHWFDRLVAGLAAEF